MNDSKKTSDIIYHCIVYAQHALQCSLQDFEKCATVETCQF